jgi:MFS family permease
MTWLPNYLGTQLGMGLTKSSTWIVVTILGMAAGIWAFGHLADRFGRRPTFLTYMIGAVVMVLIYSQLTDPNLLLIGGAVLGFFVNGMLGGYGALMSELFPTAARATAQNVLFNLGRGVGGFGPVVIGLVVGAYGASTAIALLAVLYGLDIVALLALIPERKGAALT